MIAFSLFGFSTCVSVCLVVAAIALLIGCCILYVGWLAKDASDGLNADTKDQRP